MKFQDKRKALAIAAVAMGAMFGSVNVDLTDNVRLHAKMLYNNRQSANQAAPEPIFVGPYAGTGGIADTIMISAANPYNPFGIDLIPG